MNVCIRCIFITLNVVFVAVAIYSGVPSLTRTYIVLFCSGDGLFVVSREMKVVFKNMRVSKVCDKFWICKKIKKHGTIFEIALVRNQVTQPQLQKMFPEVLGSDNLHWSLGFRWGWKMQSFIAANTFFCVVTQCYECKILSVYISFRVFNTNSGMRNWSSALAFNLNIYLAKKFSFRKVILRKKNLMRKWWDMIIAFSLLSTI